MDRCRKYLGIWLDDGELDKIGRKQGLDDATATGSLMSFLSSIFKSSNG